jgi:hypothetical protein
MAQAMLDMARQEAPMTDTPDPSRPITVIDLPEAVAVFDRVEDLQAAFYDLRTRGFSRHDISLLARQDVLEEKLGRAYWRADDLADDPNAPRAAFVSEDAIGALEGSIAGGFFYVGSMIALAAMVGPASTLAASIAAVAIGGVPASVLGVLLARRAAKPHQAYYATQIDHGGLLLWVRLRDKTHEDMAVTILRAHSGRDVNVHGWSL